MKIDMSDLVRKAKQFKANNEQAVQDATTKITLDIYTNVVSGSPVDSGEFRGDWQVETPNTPYGSGRVWNTKPYGPALAHGHSGQAPDGWIDNAIDAAVKLRGK